MEEDMKKGYKANISAKVKCTNIFFEISFTAIKVTTEKNIDVFRLEWARPCDKKREVNENNLISK